MNSTTSANNAPIATQSVFSRPAALIGGGVGLVALTAIATTLALRTPAPQETDARSATTSAPLAAQTVATPTAPADVPEKLTPPVPAKPDRVVAAAPKPVHAQRGTVKPIEPSQSAATVKAAEPIQQAASVCATCGQVESVNAVQQKGEGTGLGVAGGAVLGGVLGHQVGGGTGKSLATVLGAVGGGMAGNEVEKRARATTVYQVRVRMDDGSLRTVTQSTAPAVGQKVTVEGSTLHTRTSAS